tara:strand:- start:399 stop:2072 length:1674 start_codon:yes stop_codon:yes gene_type:complete
MVEQLPVRLVREDGDTIELLAHKVEFVVDRTSSAITTPFTDGAKFGIDLNMAAVLLELEGTFVDDKGQEKSEFATATMDFGVESPFPKPPGNGDPNLITLGGSSGTSANAAAAFADFGNIGSMLPTLPPTTPSNANAAFLNQLHGRYFDMPVGYWYKTGEPVGSRHIRFVFDSRRSGSVQEPYAYINRFRTTNLTVDSYNSATRTITVAGGDPREWFETTNIQSNSFTITGNGSSANLFGPVLSVTSNTITLFNDSITTPINGHAIKILAANHLPYSSIFNDTMPVVAIPIKHIFDLTPPAFQNGTARDIGGGTNAGEVWTHIVVNAFNSSSPSSVGGLCNRDVDAAGGKEVGDVYSAVKSVGIGGFQTFVTITQKTDVEFGALEGTVQDNIPYSISFESTGFTGGRAGKKVKSAGDKAQDLLGIVANSQNFQPNSSTPSEFSKKVMEAVESLRSYEASDKGDYILGIQIPYDSSATASTEMNEQRNFFITHGKNISTASKMSSSNPYSASDAFSPTFNGARTKGIKAIITDLQLEHQAQSNVYNFRLQMIASDFIL